MANYTNVYRMHWNSLLQTFNVTNILSADGFSFVPPLCNQKIHRSIRGNFGKRSSSVQRANKIKKEKQGTHRVLWHVVKSWFLFDISNVQYIALKKKHTQRRTTFGFFVRLNYVQEKQKKKKEKREKERMHIRAYM